MSERFKGLSYKCMCKWQSVVAYSFCGQMAKGGEPNAIDCLLCVCETFMTHADILWDIVQCNGTNNEMTGKVLSIERRQYELTRLGFLAMAGRLKPGYSKKAEEAWSDKVEEVTEKLKEVEVHGQ